MSRAIIRTPEDAVGVVPHLLGFVPTDSVVALGSGPCVRSDAPHTTEQAISCAQWLNRVADQWDGVILVVYGDDIPIATVAEHLDADVIGVVNAVDVIPADMGYLGEKPLRSREDLEAEVRSIEDANVAHRAAWAAWERGDGGKANILADRATELGADTYAINAVLTAPVDPNSELGRRLSAAL